MDNNGFVLAPLPVAPVNEADTVLLPEGLNTLKRVARLTGLKIDGSYLNLDVGFDSRRNRKRSSMRGSSRISTKTRATERPRSADGSGYLTRPSIRYGYAWNGPSRGRINSNGCCCASSSNNSAITV